MRRAPDVGGNKLQKNGGLVYVWRGNRVFDAGVRGQAMDAEGGCEWEGQGDWGFQGATGCVRGTVGEYAS